MDAKENASASDIVADIQCTPFFTIVVDKTADIPNREQVVIVLRWVASDLQVYEDFIGLYAVDDVKAATLAAIVKDSLTRLNLAMTKIHGQYYDGV